LHTSPKLKSWGILFALVLIWGTSFILIKRGLEVYSSAVVGSIRIFVSFIVLLPFALIHIRKVPKGKLKYISIIALIGTGIPAFLFAKAQTVIDSSLAGILNSLTPLFTMVLGLMFFRAKSGWINIVGVFIGLIGAIGLIYVTSNKTFEFHFSFAIYAIIATILYAVQSNMIKFYLQEVNAVMIASVGFLIIGIPTTIYLFFFSDFPVVLMNHERGWEGFMYIAILGFLASAIAIIAYNRLVQLTSAVFASSVTYFVPILALVWGILDGERFPLIASLFIAMILLGVFLVNRTNNRKNKNKKLLKDL
jgi:drug/metabolite transporter (DMT)-like permease